jgi:sugar phosphate isomerase/epimerase
MSTKNQNRREAIKKMIIASSMPLLAGNMGAFGGVESIARASAQKRDIYLFGKCLQWAELLEAPVLAKSMGFDGIDLTVRKGGHIEPKDVADNLPAFVAKCNEVGLKKPILTTGIQNVDSDSAELILKTAGKLGIKHYRLGWYEYDWSTNLLPQIENFKSQMEDLAILNKKYDISGNYQNHTGKGVGAAIWDVMKIIENTPAAHSGLEYDIRHAMVEGAYSWRVDFELAKSRIQVVDIKDFVYGASPKVQDFINVPLGEGLVDFESFFKLLNENNIYTPLSIHVEHDLGGAERGDKTASISKEDILVRIKRDLEFLKQLA